MKYVPRHRRSAKGQTLIMALFVMGILLVLGFVFIGVINQNIRRAGVAQQRSASNDLAEAGIRFAHHQLLFGVQGADFRLTPTPPLPRDPDLEFLQPDPDGPANGDQGGPDGLGAYTRVNFANGRALVRVRYAPSDTILFTNTPSGQLRQPGRARSYLIIEAVGKVGRVSPNDPTTVLGADRRESRKLIAFASIGMLEHGQFITNKDRVNRPAEIGVPRDFGARYQDDASTNLNGEVLVPTVLGSDVAIPRYVNVGGFDIAPFGGSLFSNADLEIHGSVLANLNYTLGDSILVNGRISGADDQAQLIVRRTNWNNGTGTWNPATVTTLRNATNPSLDSRRGTFFTLMGVLRDGYEGADGDGWARAVQRKDPPSTNEPDPVTGRTRYDELTRLSGALLSSGNSGRFGHGQGVYVNNGQDRQIRSDESGRIEAGSSESLLYDWFNPNNGQANSGWQGPYYVPRGAVVQLQYDGFSIRRDARATGNERTWRRPDGSNTGATEIRYRIGPGPGGRPYIVNTFTPGVNINAASVNYGLGQPFNGVLLFDGNVRVRGVIPTDVQLTLVSRATVYVEGSITKGIVESPMTTGSSASWGFSRLTRPSRSALMLIAKEYVAVNTTMFFGPGPSQQLEEVNESPGALAWNPVRVREAGGTLGLRHEQLLDPEAAGATPTNPASWSPFVWGPNAGNGYLEIGSGNYIEPKLLLSHTMDDGPAPFTFMSMDVNFGIGSPGNPSTYLFPMSPVFPWNSASGQGPYAPGYTTPGYSTPNYIPIYGLGSESWQRYPKFESAGFSLVSALGTTFSFPTLNLDAPQGRYRLLVQETNDLSFRHNNVGPGATNDWLLARGAVTPHDIRVEAALFAEEGSFVVIPGNWFNANPNDTRIAYENRVAAVGRAAADQERRDSFGAHPQMPFHGEPLDVRVTVVGSITQNMPLPISRQSEWLRKWGWIPRRMGGANEIPSRHVPAGYTVGNASPYVPNLYLIYDPALATGRTSGFDLPSNPSPYIRTDNFGRPLPPMPRLPVSPTLSYFGEVLP
jgi:hypothetical protein